MKILVEKIILNKGKFSQTEKFKELYQEMINGIASVTWADPYRFIINPVMKGNGVLPIKNNFIAHLVEKGWTAEGRPPVIDGLNPGPIDAIYDSEFGLVVAEWETGNISSSHRALNKMALGIVQKRLIAGFLVLPMRELAKYLTDRVGSYEELAPYFPLYEHLNIEDGMLGIIGVGYDEISSDVILIPKGRDGNAMK